MVSNVSEAEGPVSQLTAVGNVSFGRSRWRLATGKADWNVDGRVLG
jgi:hypothetical protein